MVGVVGSFGGNSFHFQQILYQEGVGCRQARRPSNSHAFCVRHTHLIYFSRSRAVMHVVSQRNKCAHYVPVKYRKIFSCKDDSIRYNKEKFKI